MVYFDTIMNITHVNASNINVFPFADAGLCTKNFCTLKTSHCGVQLFDFALFFGFCRMSIMQCHRI